MPTQFLRFRIFALAAGLATLAFSGLAAADPPSRVARLGYLSGPVSFSPAGEDDWVWAVVNRPLTSGDRLWTDAAARAELQVGGAMIRMNAHTGISVLNLDDEVTQLQLTQGTLIVRVRRLAPNQVFEVDTPNLAFTLRQPGEYRVTVDPDGSATDVVVRKGQGEVYGEGAAYLIDSRQPYRFSGTGLREYEYIDAPRPDEFDRWARARDRNYDNSASARYVSADVIGYQDLDVNGTWRVDATYGNVWVPTRVAAGWAPYRDGHWAWVDPWGWTWVDDAPWGFAVSHYGRWASLGGTWAWVPGPVRSRAYYAPALVAFVGGSNFQLSISSGSVGGVAWFPLGPREVYRPAYPVSRGYFENVNRSNTVISSTTINNTYNNTNVTNVVYVNRQVPGAVVAVPTTAFVQSQPVSKAAVRVSREMVERVPVAYMAPVAPTARSVRGAAGRGDEPPPKVFERSTIVHTAPAPVHAGFAAQQRQLEATPGQPLDAAARKELKRDAKAPAPAVAVVAPTQTAPAPRSPPQAAGSPGARDVNAKGEKSDERQRRGRAEGAPQGNVPGPATSPQTVAVPGPAAQPPESRSKADKSDKPGKGEQRGQPVPPQQDRVAVPAGSPAAAPARAAPAQAVAVPKPDKGDKPDKADRADPRGRAVAPPQAVTPAPAAPVQAVAVPKPDKGDKPDKADRADPRGRAAAPPPAPPQAVAPAPAAPAHAAAVPKPDKANRADKPDPRGGAVAPPPPSRASAPAPAAPGQATAPPPPMAERRDQPRNPGTGRPKDKGKDDHDQGEKKKKDGDGDKADEDSRKRKG